MVTVASGHSYKQGLISKKEKKKKNIAPEKGTAATQSADAFLAKRRSKAYLNVGAWR